MSNFSARLEEAIREKKNPVVVGLDPRLDSLPSEFCCLDTCTDKTCNAFRKFCFGVIDVVAPLVPAVKPQSAFFEQYGFAGVHALIDTIRYAQSQGLIVILDAKRGDIGSTAIAYAEGMLGRDSAWGGDALTVSPYLGDDALEPFADIAEKRGAGIFVLVKTSNPGSAMLQDCVAEDGNTVSRRVARYVERRAKAAADATGSQYGNIGAVVGATWRESLAELRDAMPHAWILVPGYGSQGGTARDVAAGFDSDGLGAIVNSSRGIIFAHEKRPHLSWQRAVEEATREMIADLRSDTPAGRLG